MKKNTCPKCKQTVPLQKTCEECGVTLTRLVKEKEEKKRLWKLKRQRKAPRRRRVVIALVVIVSAGLTAVKFIYEKTRPDTWSAVQSGDEIGGIWKGGTALKLSGESELTGEFANLIELAGQANIQLPPDYSSLEIILDNTHNPEKIRTSIRFDVSKLTQAFAPYFEEQNAPLLMDKPFIEMESYASITELNKMGPVLINHRKTKLKWQINFARFGMDDFEEAECILEKTANLKTY